MQTWIVIDCGNTYIKLGQFNKKNQILNFTKIPTFSAKKQWKRLHDFIGDQKIYFCTNCPYKTNRFQKYLQRKYKDNLICITSKDFDFIKLNKSSNRNEIGLDIYGFANYLMSLGSNMLGFSLGTGYFSLHVHQNEIVSCNIVNSVVSSFYQLLEKADLINDKIRFDTTKPLPKNGYDTPSALILGINQLMNGFILQNIEQYTSNWTIAPEKIVITGGDNHLFHYQVNHDITDHGTLLGYNLVVLRMQKKCPNSPKSKH